MSAPDPIREAVRQLRRLPGVGEKTATRLVYWLLRAPEGTPDELAQALTRLAAEVRSCTVCGNLTGTDPCTLCADGRRDPTVLCVVEHPQDVLAFERSGEFRGRYHVLHGAISPLDGVGPGDLNLRSLLDRLRGGEVREVIVATDPDVEGDATALYLARLLGDVGVEVTRLAHGISVGTEIEYADAVSLARALQNRQKLT
ncbi:MAG: recombination protein RecR [Alphaproteobacteria bacterium]|nr:recombination protein RecR [Alphaproteobacteria bacterium]